MPKKQARPSSGCSSQRDWPPSTASATPQSGSLHSPATAPTSAYDDHASLTTASNGFVNVSLPILPHPRATQHQPHPSQGAVVQFQHQAPDATFFGDTRDASSRVEEYGMCPYQGKGDGECAIPNAARDASPAADGGSVRSMEVSPGSPPPLTFPTIDRGSPATDPIQEENNEGRTTGRKKNGRNRTENSQHGQNTILPWQTDPGNFWNPDMTMLGWWNLADNPLILDFLGQSAHQSTYPYPQHIDEAELYGYDDENADGCRADRPG